MWVGGSTKWRAEKCTGFNRFSVVLACGNRQLSLLLLCQQMGGSSALSVRWALHARHVCCAGTFSPLGGSSAWPLLVYAGKPAAIVNAVWVGSTDRAVSSVPSTSALHGFLHCWNWAKSSNVCELQATRQISLNVTSWRLRPFEWTKIKGQCLCEGLSLLVACGCGGPARVTRVSPLCSVMGTHVGLQAVHIAACLPVWQAAATLPPTLMRRELKTDAACAAFVKLEQFVQIASSCFTFSPRAVVFEDEWLFEKEDHGSDFCLRSDHSTLY